MADALDVNNAVNDIVRQAVDGININKRTQTLEIRGGGAAMQQQPLTLTNHDVQYIVNLLEQHPRAVDALFIESFSLTLEALEILRAYFASRATKSLNRIGFNGVDLGNVNGRRLLSGLHGNTSVTQLDICRVGLVGQAGGAVLSELLQHNQCLTTFCCHGTRLGVEGARALQPGLRANQTMLFFSLGNGDLGDEGISLIADALQGNTTMTNLFLNANSITSNGLPHVTRLLQHPSLEAIGVDHNPGLFDNQDNYRLFLITLQNSQLTTVSMNRCRLTGHAMATLFQALSTKTTPTDLLVYDSDQLQGADLKNLLEIIPHMRNLRTLSINLDFMAESVLLSFHRNTTIQLLHTFDVDFTAQEITNGPMFEILNRNIRLSYAIMLLDSEPRRTIPLGLWSMAIERLTQDDNTGATAAYKIMREKLVMWWAPHQAMTNDPTIAPAAVVASMSVFAAIDASISSTTTTGGGRSRAQDDDSTTTTTTTTASLDPPAHKRARHS